MHKTIKGTVGPDIMYRFPIKTFRAGSFIYVYCVLQNITKCDL